MIAQDKQLIGHTLDDRYEIIECLGSGGMGVVYKARQKGLERDVAIKMPHLENISSSTSRSRFEREARTMAKFSHENIVQVYDYNAQSNRPFIVLEYVEGRELAELLTESDKISIDGVLSVCRQIARGLDYAHRHGVIHRDIKPENIVISDKRRCVKIMDFGLVRLEDGNSQDTRAGFVVGTPQYMSPEQVRAHPVGPASDIYALGIIAYCIFTGRLPFEGEGMALMMRHATETPPNPLDVNPYLPKSVGEALLQSLEKKPEARQQSATTLVDEIANGIAKYREYSYASLLRGDFREENRIVTGKLNLKTQHEDSPAERTWRPPGMGDPVPPSPTEPLETAGVFWAGSNGAEPHPLHGKLKDAGQTIRSFKTVRETLELAHKQAPSLLVVEGELEDGSGPALCRLWRAQQSTSGIPILFLGDRQQLTSPARSGAAALEVMSPDADADETSEVALTLLSKSTAGSKESPISSSSGSSGNFVSDMITRLDLALLSEAVSSRLIASRLRRENLRQTFQEIGALIRPFFPYRFLYAAFAPESPGGKGVLILDKTDPEGNSEILSAVLMRIHSEVKRAARGHKDVPKDYDLIFAKERTVKAGGVTEQSIMSVDDNFLAFPIEEGASFYGAFGMCGPGDLPTGNNADKLAEIVPAAYHALFNAWRARQAEAMRKLDPSGVWRRDHIIEYLRLALTNSESLKEPFSLILIDIDKLDHLNETYGMQRCDQLLMQIGALMNELAEGQARTGRLGSDEFLLVLPGYTIAETMKIATALHQKIRTIRLSAAAGDEGLPVKTSVGVAYRGQTERSPDQMMRAARNALGAVKSSGGDGIRAAG